MRNYFKIVTCFAFVLCTMGVYTSAVFSYSSGPPFGRTGSPADNFKTCNDTGCHNSFVLNSGSAKFSISAPSSYILGETLSVTVSFSNSNTLKHGFELSALDANNKYAGTFNTVDNQTQTSSDGNYIEHTSAGSSQSGNASWNTKWTAPSSEVQNPVTFYAAGNEANGDGSRDGDYIYTITKQVSIGTATPTPTPTPTRTPTPTASTTPTILPTATLTPTPTASVTPTPTTSVTPTLPPTATPIPTSSPTPMPTPTGCENESILASPGELVLKSGEDGEVKVTLTPIEGCLPEEGEVVTAKINKSDRKRISISPRSATTDVNGEAFFVITAKNKTGNAKVKFRYENLKDTVKVKVIK